MTLDVLQSVLLSSICLAVYSKTIALPPFSEMKKHYLGFHSSGGLYHRHDIMRLLQIQDNNDLLSHDTSALRLSYTLNRIGNQHSLGSEVIRLSKYGTDSIKGRYGLQYIFHPLAFGPYLADKYGYPTVTKLHLFDPVKTKESFRNKQGIMRVITYRQEDNEPKGHVALWDCNGFFKARDFISGHTLLSVEFWESPDTNCSHLDTDLSQNTRQVSNLPKAEAGLKITEPVTGFRSLLKQGLRHLPRRRHRHKHLP